MMTPATIFETATAAAARLVGLAPLEPRVGLVLGSGWNGFADSIEVAARLPFAELPGFPPAAVAGHRGEVVAGRCASIPLLAFVGRCHAYEGHDLATVTLPVRVLARLGVPTLVLTAAVGGIRRGLRSGDVVALSDHLNLLGANPLRGAHDDRLGSRFPDMGAVYSPRLRDLAVEAARSLGRRLPTAVYAAMPGPSYETPAEIRMLRALGADVVGMSTVPEAIVARQEGLDVLALALVTNAAAGTSTTHVEHADVLAVGGDSAGTLAELLSAILPRIAPGS